MANYDDVVANFRRQFCKVNDKAIMAEKESTELSDSEFEKVMLRLENHTVYESAKILREKWVLELDKNNAIASHFTLGEPNKRIDRRYIQNLVAFTEGGMNEIFGDDQNIYSNFEEELISCKLQVLVTDQPRIVFCNRLIEQVCYYNEYYFPVCPTMVAFFSKSDDINDKEIRKMTSEEYKRFIQLYLNNKSVEKIYANNKSVLENMLYD